MWSGGSNGNIRLPVGAVTRDALQPSSSSVSIVPCSNGVPLFAYGVIVI